jgi:integrative and conjugative element protein (TIGR02256 family)
VGELARGHQLALAQLRTLARTSGGSVSIGRMRQPTVLDRSLIVDVSISTRGIEHAPGGIRLHGRERFQLFIPEGFPFKAPDAVSTHRRWAGAPHVQFARHICLYQATSEWDPGLGMYGYIRRLHEWLTRGAANELDPIDAPLHPPAVYTSVGNTRFIASADTPVTAGDTWVGYATLADLGVRRLEITGWDTEPQAGHRALTILLPGPFTWEYPRYMRDLLEAFSKQGLDTGTLWRLLALCADSVERGQPLHVVLGTPMRRGAEDEPAHHLAVWEISPADTDALREILPRLGESEQTAQARERYSEKLLEQAKRTELAWCTVAEQRPEIVIRRDDRSPMVDAFAGRSVVIWGCGAIGAYTAILLARAGVRKLALYDHDDITPGVLVRQPYTKADVLLLKDQVLAARLLAIRPDLEVVPRYANLLSGPLEEEPWHEDADIVIDASASAVVRMKLELVRHKAGDAQRPLAAMLLGHAAERGLAVLAPAGYSGGAEDVLRAVKIDCARARHLRGFADEFWPIEPRTDVFQPEPGCSEATFRGSAAEVQALTSTMLHTIATQLLDEDKTSAQASAVVLPAVQHDGRRSPRWSWPAATTLRDGVGDYELRLSAEALAQIRGWVACAARAGDPAAETGGVLYGRRDEASAIVWIDVATGPPPDSVCSPTSFVCGTEGVPEMTTAIKQRSRGEDGYIGIWHTHPDMSADPSTTDITGMFGLVASEPMSEAVMLIVGGTHGEEQLAGYVFNGEELKDTGAAEITIEPVPASAPAIAPPIRNVGLALSGGGSRAVAFHLGCLRALHDRGVLGRVKVVSGVSGGALMSALWAYGPEHFDEFDAKVTRLLREGLQRRIVRRALLSRRLPQAMVSSVVAGGATMLARVGGRHGAAPLARRWSRTDAFEDILAEILGERRVDAARVREGLDVVINACDLRTGHAVRFGSRESGSWTLGRIAGNDVQLATAVAASAAYPLLLPALDRTWRFERRDGSSVDTRVVLADGGVFDNLGTSPLRPGRSGAHSYNVFDVPYVISCDAGRGQLGAYTPFHAPSRVKRAFEASFRKLQDSGRAALHEHAAHGELAGFVMPYLGQQDASLPWLPADLVRREEVADYPTDFAAMPAKMIELLARRGEQLTRLLLDFHCPEL